jgi:sterol desaturase/sphingolipid hydroxylase (fatty acid hydroxylase superfamily)
MDFSSETIASPLGRFLLFAGLFVLLALLEQVFAARRDRQAGDARLLTNFGFGLGNSALAALIPIGAVAGAELAAAQGLGLFHQLAAPSWLLLAALILARSLAGYGLHRASHAFPWLWRIHRVHHSDRQVDLSTGLRNHPAELLLTILVAASVTIALGPPVWVAVLAELILFAPALWTHADLRLPARADRVLRLLVVTPAMHLVHHSAARGQCDSNYGDLLSVWDRLFGSYRPPGESVARIGLGAEEDRSADNLWRQLLRPLRP